MRTAINITGELKYVLDNEKNTVVVPLHTLRASELIKQDIELVNHDYSVALYGLRYEAKTQAGTIRYLFLVEHSMAGLRPYAIYYDLPERIKAVRNTIDFSLFDITNADELQDNTATSDDTEAGRLSFWQRIRRKWLFYADPDLGKRQQQRRGGKGLLIIAGLYAAAWVLSQLVVTTHH